MSKARNTQRCIYCLKRIATTRDHVPPKNLFPKPRPNSLITVPSCKKCNKGFETDDEYFRLMLIMRDDVSEHPALFDIAPTIIRSIQRPENKRLAHKISRSFAPHPFYTWSGLYAGDYLAYDVDLERLCRTAARVVRGLFYHLTGNPLPLEYSVIASIEPFANARSPNLISDKFKDLLEDETHTIGNGVFSYKMRHIEGHHNETEWYLEFFQQVPFICLTVPLKGVIKYNPLMEQIGVYQI